jgi:uncharacterized protein YndB with AHSA1/START domain
MSSRAIRVEITVAADLDAVWSLTQDPHSHARWDARFSRIVPTEQGEGGLWRFRYERGMLVRTIRGTGISLGSRLGADGARTSALRFTTTDRLSPLRDGRGYWRYEPVEGGVRFLTGYDYEPGWGALLDRVLVRPLVAWMTAYSFARLRRWAERGEEPERWPLWRAVMPWPRDRPRASDCRWSIGRPAAMADAPADLAALAAP